MSVPAEKATPLAQILPFILFYRLTYSHMWTQHIKFKMKIKSFHVLPREVSLNGHTTGFCPVSKVRTTLYSTKIVPQEIPSK